MAKIHGPLFSLAASGSFGPRLTFSQRLSKQQVRFQRAQTDVTTTSRTTQRNYFREAVQKWADLSAADKKEWDDFID